MPHDAEWPQRRTIRLAGYDYTQRGAYFVTICTLNRECLFGQIVDGAMHLSEGGMVAQREWLRSGEIRQEIVLDAFVVMPNHLHAIVFIVNTSSVPNHDDSHHHTVGASAGRPVSGEHPPSGQTTTVGASGGRPLPGGSSTLDVPPTSMTASVPGGHPEYATGAAERVGAAGVRRTPLRRPAGASLGALINGYKAAVTKNLSALHIVSGASVWQRGYYEHVVRNEEDLDRIRRYIHENPARWALDRENPDNPSRASLPAPFPRSSRPPS